MNPLIDHLLVIALVLGAVGFFVRRFFFRGKKSCDAGCGCSATTPKIKARR